MELYLQCKYIFMTKCSIKHGEEIHLLVDVFVLWLRSGLLENNPASCLEILGSKLRTVTD